jgi:hypothetical protein
VNAIDLSRAHKIFLIGKWMLGEIRLCDFSIEPGDADCTAVFEGMCRASRNPTGDRIRDVHVQLRSEPALSSCVPLHFVSYTMQFFADTDAAARLIAEAERAGGIVVARQKIVDSIATILCRLQIELASLDEAIEFFANFARSVAKAAA